MTEKAGKPAEAADTGSADTEATDEEPGLEERLKRLDEIVAALEGDEVDLDRALTLFEEGVGHVRAAEKALAEAELRVEELLG
ncbi:MAG: exodeoxyribonuclease VII small subunit, partial [Longimicrobiales bacterium]|nr:exodeoxyribonuclease VII small subunit [Longimicrobiales bacterium]